MKVFAYIFLCFCLTGCVSNLKPKNKAEDHSAPYAGYIAINPISLPSSLFTAEPDKIAEIAKPPETNNSGSVTSTSSTGEGSNQNLKHLINNAARVSIQEVTQSGEVKYIASGISRKGSYYHATIDYIKYHSSSIRIPIDKPILDGAENNFSQSRIVLGVAVGVGLRAEASFYSEESGAKIADIVNIGASAQENKISGTMAFQTMGVESKAISDALPIPSQLSSATVQHALQTMATVKANIYSKDTNVVPQIVGIEIQSYPPGVDLADVVVSLHTHKEMIIDQVTQELKARKVNFLEPISYKAPPL